MRSTVPRFHLHLFTLFSAALLCALTRASSQQAPLPVKIADASCAKCHREIYKRYLQTPMANASGDATTQLIPGSFREPGSAAAYRVSQEDGSAWLANSNTNYPSQDGRRRLQYFLGSGHLGVTYLYSIDHYLLESPVAYYSATASYDMKPGLSGRGDNPPALPMGPGCLRCHMSGVQQVAPGTVSNFTGLPFAQTGITCESCHGDSTLHTQSGGKIAVVNFKTLAPTLRDSVCISCHLEGDISVEKPDRSAIHFKPGEPIADYLSFFVFADANASARGVSEVEQLNASVCKRTSGDKMSCMSCHDPHYSPPPTQRADFYRAKCLVCHNAPEFATTHHPENPDCTSCHMPRSGAKNIPHVAWTDHRILKQAAYDPEAGAGTRNAELVPAIPQPASSRDLALAYFQAATVKGIKADQGKAAALVAAAYPANKEDVELLGALAAIARLQGEANRAEHFYDEVLRLDPSNLSASSNLGILKAKRGDLNSALNLLQPAFDRNQNVLETAVNLAAVQCLLGNAEAVRTTLLTALRYSPGSSVLNARLHELSSCSVPATH